VPVGSQPGALAIDAHGRRAYVANHESGTVSVVDLASARVLHTVPLPGQPLSLALRPNAGPSRGTGLPQGMGRP
jgi:YVTN family beta-propeller protein